MDVQVASLSRSESEECQKRFQTAVDVIQNLPNNGSYRPSYKVMLRFYSLYKQAVCGPCTLSRPGFWDPVGRYKWDAWNRLGDMRRESAMAAYVDEMKKVAQEVIDNMPINEKTASFYHYFEPLYHVIHDLPRPPEALLNLRQDINANEAAENPAKDVDSAIREDITQEQKLDLEPVFNNISQGEGPDITLSDGLVLTSDSESELFCDSVEQLDYIKPFSGPFTKQNRHMNYTPALQVIQLGAGQGGEGAGNGPPPKRREHGRGGVKHDWKESHGSVLYNSGRQAGQQASGGGGGGHNPDRRSEGLQDTQVQEQIMLALQRLREDMQSVMERLEVVERLAAANNAQWIQMQLTSQTEVEKWWPFDVSGRTLLLLLIWPFIAQGMRLWLRQRKK